ncbi:hypothetical protein [Alienimonas californiensis]|uniref:Uncharacterized protein n=1 Tax=Alienimonas californiensis TaxID=2527989 RepID=A0A517P3R6_9PLAN|nr:hypothetical protein [Alienimonas californiensis]QDT14015.1 hypothetical protein CA12_00830 [Alienimonas californiensis]
MPCSALLLALCLPMAADPGEGGKLPLDTVAVYDLTGRGLGPRLVDEQDEAGDPRAGSGGKPTSAYELGWINKDLYFPARTVIDLGRTHDLTGAAWYDVSGDGPFEIRLFDPANREDETHGWRTLLTDDLKKYNAWSTGELSGRARYVMIVVGSPAGSVVEVVLYGAPAGEAPATTADAPAADAAPREPAPFDRLLGVNGFIDDPVDRLAPVAGTVREYHSWEWDVLKTGAPDARIAFSPSAVRNQNGTWAWDFDQFYRDLNAAGSRPAPVIQCTAAAAFNLDGSAEPPKGSDKPVPPGGDAESPASYREHAAHLFQFAARYGDRQVDDAALRLEEGQPRVSGLGLVGDVENWNEPNRTWEGRAAYFSPWELAAMTSADYDGHRGTLGPGHGVKLADPNFDIVLGGLVALDLEGLKAIKLWCDLYRDGSFPADAIAVHYYCRALDASGKEAGHGLPPEQDELRRRVREITAWRDEYLPGVEVHLGEFGYDTHPGSPMSADAVGSLSAEQVQGYWLVRSALELAAADLDRAQIFMLRDVDSESPGKFATCGLTSSKETGHQPKPSWFHVAAARAALAGLVYGSDLEDDRVRGMWFVDPNGGGRTLAVWSPTAEDRRVPDWTTPGPAPQTVTRLSDDDPAGATTPWTGPIVITEAPAFLRW